MDWAQITVTTSEAAAEAVSNFLFALEATGVELRESDAGCVDLIAHYPLDDGIGTRTQKLREFLTALPTWGLDAHPARIAVKHIASEAWQDAWRSAFPPQRVGARIVIAPTWIDLPEDEGEVQVRLDPGLAFGTGQHPTTRLALELLEGAVEPHHHVADIGTGSGILAIAAVKLGARRVDAVELDPTAIPVARTNFDTNGVGSRVSLSEGDGLKGLEGRYHLIVGNILTKAILPMIPECGARLFEGGVVIFSGILEAELPQVESVLGVHGFEVVESVREVEAGVTWVGIKAARLSGGG